MLLSVRSSFPCLTSTDVVDDIKETNEFIDDTEINNSDLLSQDEIAALREQGVSAEELIQRQIERHDRFELKTEFSKEKWRQRKEKKYVLSI
jgi:tRNA (adenine-N(1)-)-methyltransferase non-catalytic subunit